MLVPITEEKHHVQLEIAYATSNNFTGVPVYKNAYCFLHIEAEEKLKKAVQLATPMGYQIKVFDGFRPHAAQEIFWDHTPDATFIMPPEKGSVHTRGIAIDLTLIDAKTKQELDMGTEFDHFTAKAFHCSQDISIEAQRNRKILLGIMIAAGWDYFENEWWHYQLFNPKNYLLIKDGKEEDFIMETA